MKIRYILLLTFDSACLAPDLDFLLALPPEEEADVPEAPPLPPDVAEVSPWALVAAGLAAAAAATALLGALVGSGSEARAFSSIVTTLDLEAGWKSRYKIIESFVQIKVFVRSIRSFAKAAHPTGPPPSTNKFAEDESQTILNSLEFYLQFIGLFAHSVPSDMLHHDRHNSLGFLPHIATAIFQTGIQRSHYGD